MITPNIPSLLDEHVTLPPEGIHRIHFRGYQPRLQTPLGAVGFFKHHRGRPVTSSALMEAISHPFVRQIERLSRTHGVEIVRFTKGQRKDNLARERLQSFPQEVRGVVHR